MGVVTASRDWNVFRRCASAAALAIAASGCAFSTGPGPYAKTVVKAQSPLTEGRIHFVDTTESVAQVLTSADTVVSFAEQFPEAVPAGAFANSGDVVSVTIWEAPPAALFAGQQTGGLLPPNAPANGVTLPEQTVDNTGYITIPYAGRVRAGGRTPPEIARAIVAQLRGKAHQPQAVVRVVQNTTEVATVVGDVATSRRVPLTSQGERLLDAIAAAGGVKQDVNKMSLQLTRGNRVATMPFAAVLADPRQNVMLSPGDVVTALFRTSSFTVLGATGRNDEINFESTGLSLAQALGRAGGLLDNRADPRGVFVFRMESPAVVAKLSGTPQLRPAVGKRIPVIYRVNLKDAGSLFVAQQFPIENGDVLYISNATYLDLQRFVSLVGSLISPAATTTNILNSVRP